MNKKIIGIVISGVCFLGFTISSIVKNEKVKKKIINKIKDTNFLKKGVTLFSDCLSSFVKIFIKYKK